MLAAAALAALAGCGGGSVQPSADRQWIANASELIGQLRDDVLVGAEGTTSLASARHELHDDSDLYVLLVAYSDFGGCDRMLANVGVSGRAYASVDGTLRRACSHLERAAALFTRSSGSGGAPALLAASREAQRAWPLLNRAALEVPAKR